jgi:hypothetical protein
LNEGGIRERRIRKRGLDLEGGFFFWRRRRNQKRQRENLGEERKDAKFLGGFLLVDWCCWDFGLRGQEI